eukprot:m.24238 g.24238  ORF g.24238 m.24238 type:complete len:287 (+) comp8657_c0_seq1:581-1441(+)
MGRAVVWGLCTLTSTSTRLWPFSASTTFFCLAAAVLCSSSLPKRVMSPLCPAPPCSGCATTTTITTTTTALLTLELPGMWVHTAERVLSWELQEVLLVLALQQLLRPATWEAMSPLTTTRATSRCTAGTPPTATAIPASPTACPSCLSTTARSSPRRTEAPRPRLALEPSSEVGLCACPSPQMCAWVRLCGILVYVCALVCGKKNLTCFSSYSVGAAFVCSFLWHYSNFLSLSLSFALYLLGVILLFLSWFVCSLVEYDPTLLFDTRSLVCSVQVCVELVVFSFFF